MATATETKLWTTAELLALPEDGVDRWLIKGQLREHRDPELRQRNRKFSRAMTTVATFLKRWEQSLPDDSGQTFCGNVGCSLSHDPDTTVGIDVAFFGADVVALTPDDTELLDGPPILAVEILSPYDTLKLVNEKIDAYLAAGVPLVWIVDPYKKTVVVHRPDAPPELFNETQMIAAEPHLPGFSAAVADFFR